MFSSVGIFALARTKGASPV